MKLVNMDGNKKAGKILFETGILIMIATLLSTIGIWQCISGQWKVSLGGDLFFQAFVQSGSNYVITYLNQESIYISFLSVLFSFLGNKEELVLIINLILQLMGIFFFYLGSKKLFHFVFPLAVAIISGILSGCFYPVVVDSSMHMIWFLSGLLFWICTYVFRNLSGMYLKYIFIGILLGVSSYVDIAGAFLLITFVFVILIDGTFTLRERLLQLLCFLLCVINGFFIMFYLWNAFLFDGNLFRRWINERVFYLRTENVLSQYISLALILAVNIIFFTIKLSKKVVIVKEENTDKTIPEINVDVKQEIPEKIAEKPKQEFMEVTITTENKQESQITEFSKPINFIENPLPVPKKHVKKEMNYAFEPTPDQMHYDLNNYNVDDDYDLKDM